MAVIIFDGYSYRDATENEIDEFERAIKEEEEERKHRNASSTEIASALESIL